MDAELKENLKDLQFKMVENSMYYRDRIKTLKRGRDILLCFNTSIPIISIILMYVFKNGNFEDEVSFTSFLVSTSLFILTTLSMLFKLDETIIEYRKSLEANCYNQSKIDRYLNKLVDEKSLDWFLEEISRQSGKDVENVHYSSVKKRQELYREAVKEFEPNDARCPECRQLVWNYKKIKKFSKNPINRCCVCGIPIELDNSYEKETNQSRESNIQIEKMILRRKKMNKYLKKDNYLNWLKAQPPEYIERTRHQRSRSLRNNRFKETMEDNVSIVAVARSRPTKSSGPRPGRRCPHCGKPIY